MVKLSLTTHTGLSDSLALPELEQQHVSMGQGHSEAPRLGAQRHLLYGERRLLVSRTAVGSAGATLEHCGRVWKQLGVEWRQASLACDVQRGS